MLELYDQISNLSTTQPWAVPPFLTLFSLTYIAALGAAPVNATNGSELLSDVDPSFRLDNSWTHPQLAPLGLASNQTSTFYPKLHQWAHIPFDDPESAYLPGGNAFLYADLASMNEFTFSNASGHEELKFSFFPFALVNLKTDADFITVIKDLKQIIADSPLKDHAFVYGLVFTYWEMFLSLEEELIKIFAIDVALIFLITLFLLSGGRCRPTVLLTAFTSTMACVAIVVEIYGVSTLFLKFNIFIATTLLMAMGITIEFTAHFAAAFAFGQGTPQDRLGQGMVHTFPALFEGSISTACSLIPIAFHHIPFVVEHFCYMFLLVVIVGMANGFVFMPALLAVLSPIMNMGCCRETDA